MDQKEMIESLCKQIRAHILTSTTHAGSGHPTSSLSAVELITALFFGGYFRQDIAKPHDLRNDRFILSKGHAAPLLYALYRVAGALTEEDLMKLRDAYSRLEGHPTPLFPYHDVETGSLGQGLSIGLGMALGQRLRHRNSAELPRVFVLMGDSEVAEGQVWEAAQLAAKYNATNLTAILDVNRLGQRGETMIGWDLNTYAKRFDAFGWHTVIIQDGHQLDEIIKAYSENISAQQKPTIFIAKTVKGKGVSFLENKEGWHGKPVPKDKLEAALSEIGSTAEIHTATLSLPPAGSVGNENAAISDPSLATAHLSGYELHDNMATREAYGDALVELGAHDPSIVVLDAEVSNSTFAEKFKKNYPDRFFEMYIAEQNMVSVALGLSKVGFKPYISSFAAFLSRSFDQLRIGQYFYAQLVTCGSHAGVSIGEDGSSQMGLEDIAMFRSLLHSTVLYPSDANAMKKLASLALHQKGITYLRATRAALPVLYSSEEVQSFTIGGSNVLRSSDSDQAVIVTAGITLHEALKAYDHLIGEGVGVAVVDLYSIKPIDLTTLARFASLPMIVVEDHYPAGGIGEAVLAATANQGQNPRFTHLCVRNTPHSGSPEQNLQYQEINASAIVKAVRHLISKPSSD